MELPKELLEKVCMHLTVKDLGSFGKVCQTFQEVTASPSVLRYAAHQIYSEEIAEKTIGLYEGNWKDLLMDKNIKGAFPVAHLAVPCRWKANNLSRHYCCLIIGIQWDRVKDEIRLCLDARGENDLRHPSTSSICYSTNGGASKHIINGVWNAELEARGHYKGYLSFRGAQWRQFQESESLTFCYANRFHSMGDYEAVQIPVWSQLQFDGYTLDESMFAGDTTESELARWRRIVPISVIERRGRSNAFTRVWWV